MWSDSQLSPPSQLFGVLEITPFTSLLLGPERAGGCHGNSVNKGTWIHGVCQRPWGNYLCCGLFQAAHVMPLSPSWEEMLTAVIGCKRAPAHRWSGVFQWRGHSAQDRSM